MQSFDEKLDVLLKDALRSDEKPSEALNQTVKSKLCQQREKTISLWWLPMLFATLTCLLVSALTYLFIPFAEVKMVMIGSSIAMASMSILLTIIGVRCFGLKKGAIITL